MGVKGLWSLLNPVARPVQLESMEGKRLAIDSSIWLYQFQATMRDKDGRVLVNAHVLGFLRRINKLLFHGIKPVFVFDGGAPGLKRATIAERKKKKAGAAQNHAKLAEKLFAAQMRREAVRAAQVAEEQRAARASARAAVASYEDMVGDVIPEDAAYLEELEGRPGPSTASGSSGAIKTAPVVSQVQPELTEAEKRRQKFRKHDPYRLPEASMPTVSTDERPDARLATEAELQQFIDEMHPEDIDVESAEFRALPTEVQYEIIGDLRSRSRQQSHKRLTDMLRAAPTALDFSRAQIRGVSQRNALTQQLLTVTDMVGSAHLTIPVRIAAERNREYVLVKKSEDEGGGWALGIREGTKEKPIKIDHDDEEEKKGRERDESSEEESDDGTDDEDDFEIDGAKPKAAQVDEDLRAHRRQEVLQALMSRYVPKPTKPLRTLVKPFGPSRQPGSKPLFDTAAEDDAAGNEMDEAMDVSPTANDEALALAIQQEELGSDEDEADPDLARALAMSRQQSENGKAMSAGKNESDSEESMEEVSLVPSTRTTPVPETREVEDEEDDFVEVEPVLIKEEAAREPIVVEDSDEEDEVLFADVRPVSKAPAPTRMESESRVLNQASSVSQAPPQVPTSAPNQPPPVAVSQPKPVSKPIEQSTTKLAEVDTPKQDRGRTTNRRVAPTKPSPSPLRESVSASDLVSGVSRNQLETMQPQIRSQDVDQSEGIEELPAAGVNADALDEETVGDERSEFILEDEEIFEPSRYAPPAESRIVDSETEGEDDADDSRSIEWSRSPSPIRRVDHRPKLQTDDSATSIASIPSEPESDAEMAPEDVAAEEDDYARFMAQIKNRDLNAVRTEIDEEIRNLNTQNKVAMRDSDEITQAMVGQIQALLRHFGIPYITAPMEAEAQCAKLAELGLVDGIITDDSDVFLFGGTQCFKNIFNDAKYAECFLATDLDRELSLNRERLISLAYLLGSDYTIGLPGVGPVVALELLANFPGPRGIERFKEWWMKVQKGKDNPIEADSKWKQAFKKRHAGSIYLTADWPNGLVREAYLYPTTDDSDEPFHWGFPRLSALRGFIHEELSWSISKVDDELKPIIQRIAQRGRAGALNVQSTLDPFFDRSLGSGVYAPRNRKRATANVSKRLMAVIKEFREAEARASGRVGEVEWGEMMQGVDESDPKGKKKGGEEGEKKRKRKGKGKEDEEGKVEGEDGGGDGVEQATKKGGVKRQRKGTVSSVAPSEASVGSEATTGTASSGRGRGRGKGKGKQSVNTV